MATLEQLIKLKTGHDGGVNVTVSAGAGAGEKKSTPEAAGGANEADAVVEANQSDGGKKEVEKDGEPRFCIAVEQQELVMSYVVMREPGEGDAATCEKQARKHVEELEEVLKRDGTTGYIVKKKPQSYAAKPTGLVEMVVDAGIEISDRAEEFWGEKFVDVFPSLEGCTEYVRVPKGGEHGRLLSTFEAYNSLWAASNRINYEGSAGGFVSMGSRKGGDLCECG